METFVTYLLKSSVWLTGFAVVYFLFLRNERYFLLNRIYLGLGILGSIIFPLFTWHYTVVLPVTPMAEISEPQIIGTTVTAEPFPTQSILLYIYVAVAIYLLFRAIRQTINVLMIVRKSETLTYHSAKLIRTTKYPASFSFFSFVFVNPSTTDTETNEIVNHELEHIRQRHWIDLLLFEILCTIQWFNPASWLYGRFIRQNHEYLADERALQRTSNPAIYRAALLNQMFGGPVISLANSFNYSLNKKRFNMMKQTISSPIRKLKLLLVLPLIAGVFYAFAAPEYKFVQAENSIEIQKGKTVTGKVISEDGKPLKASSIVVSGKTIGTVTDANGNFKLEMPDDSPIMISYVGFGSQEVKPDFEKEMVVTMKRKTISIEIDNQASEIRKKEQIDLNKSNALVIVDGKEITKAEMVKINPEKIASIDVLKDIRLKNMDKIDPESVESMAVLKDESATKKYGDKAKNGVIEITSKSKTPATTIEEKPSFPGGMGALFIFVSQSLIYPTIALENGICGKVFIKFVVTKDGSVTDAKVSRGVDPSLDSEALRIVNSLPRWKPGELDVTYEIPITFTIPKDYHPKSREKLRTK